MSQIRDVFYEQAALYGTEELSIAPVAFTETFFENNSLDADKTYQFKDHSGRNLMLNCDSLPAVMRAYIADRRSVQSRYMFSIPVFRYRNTKLRYYHHLGITFVNDSISDGGELSILSILISSLNIISSYRISLTLNDFNFWRLLFAHYGFSEKDAKDYCFSYRFKKTTEEVMDEKETLSLDKFYSIEGFKKILDALHDEEPKTFFEQWGIIRGIIPNELSAILDEYYKKVMNVIAKMNVDSCIFDINDFHSSEFFSGLSYQIFVGDDKKRIGDGGSYHEYGKIFSGGEIKSLCSGVLRHEDLISISDKLVSDKRVKILVSIITKNQDFVQKMLQNLRENDLLTFDVYEFIKKAQLDSYLKNNDITHFFTIGDKEIKTGLVRVLNIKNNLYSDVNIEKLVGMLIG